VGEFDSKSATINVNLNALQHARQETDRWFSTDALLDAIVAHELGHFFDLREADGSVGHDRSMSELVAHSFTQSLLELPFSSDEYEGLWRN
jgi:predicted SprT family Zn-dependent metalloprotease